MKVKLKISTKKNILEFLKKNSKKRVLILTGKKSFFGSGANKLFSSYKIIFKKKQTQKWRNLRKSIFKLKNLIQIF